MSHELNHIIIHSKNRRETAAFLTEIMGIETPPLDWGRFTQVGTSNGVGIDFADDFVPADEINLSHIAFLVTDDEFDAILKRITARSLPYFADPGFGVPNEINHDYDGRGLYLRDPGGTVAIEFITTPYGETFSVRPTQPQVS
jgi:extradiol dioxygenase family protein